MTKLSVSTMTGSRKSARNTTTQSLILTKWAIWLKSSWINFAQESPTNWPTYLSAKTRIEGKDSTLNSNWLKMKKKRKFTVNQNIEKTKKWTISLIYRHSNMKSKQLCHKSSWLTSSLASSSSLKWKIANNSSKSTSSREILKNTSTTLNQSTSNHTCNLLMQSISSIKYQKLINWELFLTKEKMSEFNRDYSISKASSPLKHILKRLTKLRIRLLRLLLSLKGRCSITWKILFLTGNSNCWILKKMKFNLSSTSSGKILATVDNTTLILSMQMEITGKL